MLLENVFLKLEGVGHTVVYIYIYILNRNVSITGAIS